MNDRLPTHLEVGGLIRNAHLAGGFGTVIRRGDPDRGALILMIVERGSHRAFLERTLSPDGSYRWQAVGPRENSGPEIIADWSRKRVSFDSDLWLIELDIPSPERFIAETTGEG